MDWHTYSSEVGAVGLEELTPEQLEIRKTMLEMDPPRHRELRNITHKRFTPRGVARYEDYVREVARTVLDRALERETFDFVSAVSRELPIRVLCVMMGVPDEDADRLIEWGDRMIGNQETRTGNRGHEGILSTLRPEVLAPVGRPPYPPLPGRRSPPRQVVTANLFCD